LEEFVKLRVILGLFSLSVFAFYSVVSGQVDSIVGQFTNSDAESFAGGISGNGRFVVVESRGNIATVNPRNEDGNREIFLFDYAQRHIFQITDTKSVLFDPSQPATFNNIRVEIANTRPVISNDGRWIAFSSNATSSTPAEPNSTNPGSFDGNILTEPTPTPTPTPSPSPSPTASPSPTPTPAYNPLQDDGNLEMWMYQIPAYAPADLRTGEEIPFVDLSGGQFIAVTNTPASRLPVPATQTTGAFVAEDNHNASIDDDGSVIAFVSTRDLVPGGNPFPDDDNDEIFTFVRSGMTGTISQVTQTPRGPIFDPIYNKHPSISGDGSRVIFASTGDNPIIGMTGGNNPESSRNEEIFLADLDAAGAPTGNKLQLTVTTPTNPGDVVNILDIGRRLSRDGRFLAFDSAADLANEHGGTNQNSFALYLYDLQNPTSPEIKRIGPRSDADEDAGGGDVTHYPGFSDYDINGTAQSLVFSMRLNITPQGTIPANEDDGLNPTEGRPVQIYSYPIGTPKGDPPPIFTRLTKLPVSVPLFATTQAIPSDSTRRITFNLALTEVGTGNFDGQSESYYLYTPVATSETAATRSFFTGASRWPINVTPAPSPSPSPSPTPTPTPSTTTPASVLGMSPGMLVVMSYAAGLPAAVDRTAVGSFDRSFPLPIELSGVTVSINKAAAGIKQVRRAVGGRTEITFVVPPAIGSAVTGTAYELVVNNNGVVSRGDIVIVPTRPDIFTSANGPGGRAAALNVVNRVHRTEPFTVTTIRVRGGQRVPTTIRLRVTGILNTSAVGITIKIGNTVIGGTSILTGGVPAEPGVQTVDFNLPPSLDGAGDQPIIIQINAAGTIFSSRLEDTAPRIRIL
jgi:hypothetical protein